jgi:hypothetical protein
MKGTIVPISRKRRGARKHRINVTKDALLDRFAGALERDDIQIPGQGAWRDEPLWGYQKINKQLGQRFEYKDISTEEAVEGMNRIFDYVPTVEEIDNGFDMSKWLAEEMKTAMDRAWNEQVIIPLFGSPDPVEPQGVASVYGPLTNHQQDVVDFIKDELTKEFAWVCTFCAKGDHAMLVGHPKCECCPTHYKSIHDL